MVSRELAILVPVLRRPHRVAPMLESIAATTSPKPLVLFIADEDDTEEFRALEAAGAERLTVAPGTNYARKINLGIEATGEPLLFTAADDLRFHEDWFARARKHLGEEIDVVGTNDIANPRVMCGKHSTHTLVRRSYVERFGTIDEPGKLLHEGYFHEYADDELVQTAMRRGRYAHAFDAIVEHLHPIVGDRPDALPDDETYRLGRSRTRLSRKLFARRRHLWA